MPSDKPPNTAHTVAIIGGGPAGLMAAETLAATGARVTVYDQMPSVGRKFLMAGRGGLNLTHSEPLAAFIRRYGVAATWLRPAIEAYPPSALRDWCETLGQSVFTGSSGRVFPQAMKASPLLRAWLGRLRELGVTFALRHRWQGWDGAGRLIFMDGDGEQVVKADAVILALGGASWPKLGSDGAWADHLQQRGIDVTPLRPANCGFTAAWTPYLRDRFAGQPLKPVSLSFGGAARQGELTITRDGVEGGLIYAFSGPLREAIARAGACTVHLDLKPGVDLAVLTARLSKPRGGQSAASWLRKSAALDPLAIALLHEGRASVGLPMEAATMAALIKAAPLRLTGTAGLARAISTAGGIAASACDGFFMLKAMPGVFAIGEMLDWEAPTGGYLLQAAFSTAVRAAAGVQIYLKTTL